MKKLVGTWRTSATLLLLSILSAGGESEQGIPDLTQTDPRGEFARGGKSYCGPVAVSNSLMWLYHDDLKRLGMSQYDLVNQLASESHMKTHPVEGTGPNGIMLGVSQFLRERGLAESDYSLAFQGWRSHRTEFSAGVKEPQFKWIEETLASGGAAWINLGWYRKDRQSGDYERVGGHWVTVVDAGKNHEGKPDPAIVVIHDPAPRAGEKPVTQFVKLIPLKVGNLVGKTRNLPRPVAGLYQMAGDMRIKSSADCAILDGVVALRFK